MDIRLLGVIFRLPRRSNARLILLLSYSGTLVYSWCARYEPTIFRLVFSKVPPASRREPQENLIHGL